MAEVPKKEESKVEVAKRSSRHLRGSIAETLASDATHFSDDDVSLLKFHGTYQQDDRDLRHERRKQGLEEAYQFMVRVAIPAGVVSADQYLALDQLADAYGNHSLRITTRQGFQFHGVLKRDLKATIAGINHTLLTTISACGDVERNVMACPAPLQDEAHVTLRRVAREVAVQLRPKTRAYHEIWLDGEKYSSTEEEEPFYDGVYLPRKFKTGIALANDNCVDVFNDDCGLIALLDGATVAGYNVVVGGGMGMTHGKADTAACLARNLGYVEAEHVVETVRTVCAIFRDFGNRADRRHARLKYLLAEWGMDRFRAEFRSRATFELAEWQPMPSPAVHDHLGRLPQDDGRWFYGVFVENGRIHDTAAARIKTAFRDVVTRFRPEITLTPHQNLLFTGLSGKDVDAVERLLVDHGVIPAAQLSAARRYSMACPALPTCGLAMADSERVMPSVVDAFEAALSSLGLRDEPITLRMTGCPNGCARPYTADIAFVGRRPNIYHVYVGGGLAGDRAVDLYAADVAVENLVPTLRPLLVNWARRRHAGEGLGDFYQRLLARTVPRMSITGKEEPTQGTLPLEVLS
ncbi:MAG: NADPH-dependent assimilatory sulfite reductase hemoprotein subunit [Planctomycetes bacterium]|nr:NADPH-dependent assimilatory sulfite reductase hemoprotein subunit [Planctomycetota bacterium]